MINVAKVQQNLAQHTIKQLTGHKTNTIIERKQNMLYTKHIKITQIEETLQV